MEKVDRAILELLQVDCTLSIQDIAERVGLGSTACWRRIQKLEEAGVVRRRVALLDAQLINVGVTVFVSIRTAQHTARWLQQFHASIFAITEVVEVYRMAGNTDYLLRVVVPDIASYDRVYKRIIETPGLNDVSSSFSMEQIKYTTELPLQYAT
jgi:Lrp/AsnC family transcriptional regulator